MAKKTQHDVQRQVTFFLFVYLIAGFRYSILQLFHRHFFALTEYSLPQELNLM